MRLRFARGQNALCRGVHTEYTGAIFGKRPAAREKHNMGDFSAVTKRDVDLEEAPMNRKSFYILLIFFAAALLLFAGCAPASVGGDGGKGGEFECTISVRCDTILDNMGKFDEDKLSVLPEDGIIIEERTVIFYGGESVFDVLQRETRESGIHMEASFYPIYESAYIEGINNIYEHDCGELSGWMYKVNGEFVSYGPSRFVLEENDEIEWLYTCDLGRDIGGYFEGMDLQ